ncbi:hypothetical protein AB0395_27910 [Streptosporangium sp. NPDC051023]|uniref:hypothetical protein n=1 Tax=Streptosporangium sp. NPDC051023 TaxID=3155410 RepID=UPI00344E60A3
MRRMISVIFIVLGCVSAPLALVGFWAADWVAGAERYVETMAPLAVNPAVQGTVTDRVTAAITEPLRELDASVPDHAVHMAVDAIVTGDRFPAIWRRVNQEAHRRLITALSDGGGGARAVRAGSVGLDLTPIYELARNEMAHSSLPVAARLPGLHPTIELFSASDLAKVRLVRAWLVETRPGLPILSAALLVTGTLLARDRQCALIGAGLGLAGAMVLLALLLVVVRSASLPDPSENESHTGALTVIFDALTGFLWADLRTVFAVGLVVAVIAFAARQARLSRTGSSGAEPTPEAGT